MPEILYTVEITHNGKYSEEKVNTLHEFFNIIKRECQEYNVDICHLGRCTGVCNDIYQYWFHIRSNTGMLEFSLRGSDDVPGDEIIKIRTHAPLVQYFHSDLLEVYKYITVGELVDPHIFEQLAFYTSPIRAYPLICNALKLSGKEASVEIEDFAGSLSYLRATLKVDDITIYSQYIHT